MFGVVRETTVDPVKWAKGHAQREEFYAMRAQQPGYQGSIGVGADNDRVVTVTLWDSEEQWEAVRPTLNAAAERLLAPLWASPSQILSSGPVVQDEVTKA